MTSQDWLNIRAICCADGIERVSEAEQDRLEDIMVGWGWRNRDAIPGDVWTSQGLRACELLRDAQRLLNVLTVLECDHCPLSRDNVMETIEAMQ